MSGGVGIHGCRARDEKRIGANSLKLTTLLNDHLGEVKVGPERYISGEAEELDGPFFFVDNRLSV